MKKLLKFLHENILWLIFIILFTALFLINILVPNIESISWLNSIVKFPFILTAGLTLLVGIIKTLGYIVGFFECDNVYQASSILIVIVISLVIVFQIL